MHPWRFAANFPISKDARQVSLLEVPRTSDSRLVPKGRSVDGRVDENWMAGRLTGALNLVGEEVDKEGKVGVGTMGMGEGQTYVLWYAREHWAEGGCAFMDANRFYNYAHMDKFGRVNWERAKKKEGTESKVVGKRPSDGSSEGTG